MMAPLPPGAGPLGSLRVRRAGRTCEPAGGGTDQMATTWRDLLLAGATALATVALGAAPSVAETLRVVMHSDLKVVDPVWTTAYISRNHGYMIYDTLFSLDENFEPKPQMVDRIG